MNNRVAYKSLGILAVIMAVMVPLHMAHAFDWGVQELILTGAAWFANLILTIAGWLVTLTAALLNVSINITLHIKEFVTATEGVYLVWQTLRDLTGLLIIFILLYTSFKIILGMDEKINELIKNVVIAGILINFSFFITGVLIDASNIVSLSLYNAIAPPTRCSTTGVSQDNIKCMTEGLTDSSKPNGGLAALLIQKLKIQDVYDPNAMKLSDTGGFEAFIKIAMMSSAGTIIMVTTALSFAAAALAFIIRLVILIFLLAFSPVWFAASIVPGLDEWSKKFWKTLKGQLLFMPIYLILLYAALKMMSGMSVLGNYSSGASVKGVFGSSFAIMFVNYAFVIIMLNLPLLVAASFAGIAGEKLFGKLDAFKMWKSVGIKGSKGAFNNTVGRGASALARNESFKTFASKSSIGELAYKATTATSKNYSAKLDKQVEARTKFAESLGYDEKVVAKLESDTRYEKNKLNELKQKLTAAKKANNATDIAYYQDKVDRQQTYTNKLDTDIIHKKNERKANYAGELSAKAYTKPIGGLQTLYTKVARKNKAAAAKINVQVWQKLLDDKKNDLKDLRNDIKQTINDLEKTPDITQNATVRKTLSDKIDKMREREATLIRNPKNPDNDIALMGVDELQDAIDAQKLIK